MDWFKKEKGDNSLRLPEPPRLPELPKLDDINFNTKETLPQLPSYPQSSFGDKFSKNAIKDAVSGGEEDEEDADESMNIRTMPKPPKMPEPRFNPNMAERRINPFAERRNIPIEDYEAPRSSSTEPVFVRLDKFNESLKIFEEAKSRISEIESTLNDIKKKRSEEDRQLEEWENEMQNLKNQFEKISKNVFSKVR